MVEKSEIETFVFHVSQELNFHNPDVDLLNAPQLDGFIDAGFALLEHYRTTNDVQVNDAVLGAFVDCAMAMHGLAVRDGLNDEQRRRAEEMTAGFEDIVNQITSAIEKNIADQR